jgi:hypothetical protein
MDDSQGDSEMKWQLLTKIQAELTSWLQLGAPNECTCTTLNYRSQAKKVVVKKPVAEAIPNKTPAVCYQKIPIQLIEFW